LANGTNEEKLAASDSLNDKPGYCSEDGINDHIDTTEKEGEVVSSIKYLKVC
jgi:hypothetical protein